MGLVHGQRILNQLHGTQVFTSQPLRPHQHHHFCSHLASFFSIWLELVYYSLVSLSYSYTWRSTDGTLTYTQVSSLTGLS